MYIKNQSSTISISQISLLKPRSFTSLILSTMQLIMGLLLFFSLDLSAFDTIDHTILLNRLTFSFSITGSCHIWLKSHLFNRSCAPSGRGTIVSIVSCRCAYCCLETISWKITRHYSRYCAVAFCYVHKCELSYMCPGHDMKLHPHRVELYRIGCVGSGLVLVKALT